MDDKLKQTMIARYQNDGHSVLDLAREFHLGQSKIREILRDSGVLRTRGAGISLAWKRGKRVRPESFTNVGRTIDVNRVREMFGAGLNPSEIGRELRVASRRVQMILASEGLIFGKGRFLCDSCENVCDGSAQRKFCSSCVTAGFHRRFAKFGVGKKVWDVMLAGQGGHCALCEREPTFVDHDHVTGKVRGLLCNGCNTALGQVDRDVEWTVRARSYKEFHG